MDKNIKATVAFHAFNADNGIGAEIETRRFEVEAADATIEHPHMNLARLVATHIQRIEGSTAESLNLATIRLVEKPGDIDDAVLLELVESLTSRGYWDQFEKVEPITDERI